PPVSKDCSNGAPVLPAYTGAMPLRLTMRETFMLKALFVTTSMAAIALATPVRAQDIKPEVEKIGAAYTDCVAKHDAACVASLYSKDGIQVNPVGEVKTDLKATYEDYFKDGEDQIAVKVNYAQPLGNDMAMAAATSMSPTMSSRNGVSCSGP